MTYQAQADLATDQAFTERLGAALTTEARAQTTDSLGKVIMSYPVQGTAWFIPFISSAPGFADKYTAGGQSSILDGDILSAVQASWADVKTVHDLT
jgi:hypothetical protein